MTRNADMKRAAAAERMRRYRARRAAGECRVNFDLWAGGIALLVDLGWLADAERTNPDAIRTAFDRFANAAATAAQLRQVCLSPGPRATLSNTL